MKFVTLALAVFLAVGCQAASLQADAPAGPLSLLEQARGYLKFAMNQIKDSAHNVANGLPDEETKAAIISRVDAAHAYAVALQQQVEPMTDSAVATLAEATADLRANIQADLEALKAELEPKREKLRQVVSEHVEEYRALLDPVMKEYQAKHTQQMEELKGKLEPVLTELRTKIETNVEETKAALVPIIDAVRARITDRIEGLKVMATPYIEEYKDQLKTAYNQAQQIDIAAAQERLRSPAMAVKDSFDKLLEEVRKIMGQ